MSYLYKHEGQSLEDYIIGLEGTVANSEEAINVLQLEISKIKASTEIIINSLEKDLLKQKKKYHMAVKIIATLRKETNN